MQIEDFIKQTNLPAFRLQQWNQAKYQHFIETIEQLTTWPVALREQLSQQLEFSPLIAIQEQLSAKKDTVKVLFSRKIAPQQKVETVLMMHQDGRRTVCVSCMVGCPVGCHFCATGSMGFLSNLTAEEIVEQVLYFARLLKKQQQKVTNIVFMGMGEPLLNLTAVQEAIEILTDPKKMALSPGRLTLSTSGVIAPLRQLLSSDFKCRLAISLHAPTQSLREQLMPIARSNPLEELLTVIDEYTSRSNKRVSFEYLLLKNINDKQRHAEKLAQLLRGRLVHVNLIPYNQVTGKTFQTSPRPQIERFAYTLQRAHIPHTIRVSMGQDIAAACGQLAKKTIT